MRVCISCSKRERYLHYSYCYPCRKARQGSEVYSEYLRYDRDLTAAELLIFGFWAGDGTWRGPRSPELVVTKSNLIGVLTLIDRLKISYGYYEDRRKFRTEPLCRLNLYISYGMRMFDLGFKRSWVGVNKQLPECLISKNNSLPLLSGLWMSDGSTQIQSSPAYYSTSLILISQAERLVKLAGYSSTIYLPKKRRLKQDYILSVTGSRRHQLMKELSLWGNREKA